MFVIVWQFDVQLNHVTEFEEQYSATGAWAKLFSKSNQFLRTRLLKEAGMSRRYVTFDLWKSEDAFQEFAAEFAQEYKDLNAKTARLTIAETRLGSFTTDAANIF